MRPPSRRRLRAAAVVLPVLLALAVPAVAQAAPADDLPGHTGHFTTIDGFLIFFVAPVGVFLLVALLVMRPGTAPKAQRYRPGRDWDAEPSWSGLKPAAPDHAEQHQLSLGEQPMPVLDGAPEQEHADSMADDAPGEVEGDVVSTPRGDGAGTEGGGARGSW